MKRLFRIFTPVILALGLLTPSSHINAVATGQWNKWFLIHPEVKFQPGATVTAVWANTSHLDLFATGNDGAIWSSWWEVAKGWQPWFLLHPEVKFQPGAAVTAVWANTSHLDLFITGNGGAVWSTWWEAAKGWQPWFLLHPEVKFQPGATVTAVWANTSHLDLFVTGNDGADGIFLDSWGWQMNWYMYNQAEQRHYVPIEYAQGVIGLTHHLRNHIQAIKPDAVVLGETTSGPMGRHWDGGFSADFNVRFGPNRGAYIGHLTASPVRYGMPQVNFMSNGLNLNELSQIYAAGHNLALCCGWSGNFMGDNRTYVKNLVQQRQAHKNALIYGTQLYQPTTGSDSVAAYFYQGTQEQVITMVNTSSDITYVGSLALHSHNASSIWRDVLTGTIFTSDGAGQLAVSDPAAGLDGNSAKNLRILVRQNAGLLRQSMFLPFVKR